MTIFSHKICRFLLFCSVVVLNLFTIPNMCTAGEDAGLITQLQGPAVYQNKLDQKMPAPVQVFMKVRKGDQFEIPKGTALQLTYRDNGRQETWEGPVTIIVGDMESQPQGIPAPAPKVETCPLEVSQRLSSSSLPLPRSQISSAGGVPLRGGSKPTKTIVLLEEDKKTISAAEGTYKKLRQGRSVSDFTPELYLISVLADYKQYEAIDNLLVGLLAKHPEAAIVKDLKTWNDACREKQQE